MPFCGYTCKCICASNNIVVSKKSLVPEPSINNYYISFSSLCTPTKDSEPLLKNGTPQNGQSKSSFGVADNNGGMKGQQQPRQQSRSEKAKIGDADEPKKKQGCCALMWN